jgi:L-ascorbate metabolism protein UlaG (beta-lactamase superfamily)
MFRKGKPEGINSFFALPLVSNEVAIMFLGTSGVLAKTMNHTILIDPGNLLKNDEIKALKEIQLMLFTHNHLDHYSSGKTMDIFKVTGTKVLAEPKVAKSLKGKIPNDKLTEASSGNTYTFDEITVRAVQGIHRGPIMLYQIKLDDVTLFHAGDSGYVPLKDYASDVAFLPTGRMSPTASPENAYKMAVDLRPEVAVAMHGSQKQKKQFSDKIKEGFPQTTVLILEPFKPRKMQLRQKP